MNFEIGIHLMRPAHQTCKKQLTVDRIMISTALAYDGVIRMYQTTNKVIIPCKHTSADDIS